jgi:alcohol dehydrogenase YqhD (iron-dependent ADH family)
MQPFTLHFPTKLVFGSGQLGQVGSEAKALGKRPLLLTGKTAMQKSGVLAKVLGLLKAVGVEPVVFEKVEPNPRRETLDQAVQLGIDEKCDFVIGLGGGSPMDSAKAVAAALAESKRQGNFVSVWDFTSGSPKRLPVKNPFATLLISSTAATGSEGNCASVITWWQTHEKAVLWDLGAFPSVSIIDPEIMRSLPISATRDGVVDLMLHVLEQSFNGDDKAIVQDATAAGLCRGAMVCLDRAEQDLNDITARENISWASVNALLAGGGPNFGRTGAFTVHHLEHPLSGYTDVAHGRGLAALWPAYLRYILEKKEAKIAQMGADLWNVPAGASAGAKTCDALEAWLTKHEIRPRLSQFGVDEAMITKMADDAVRLSGGGKDYLNAPIPLTREKCAEIYKAAL